MARRTKNESARTRERILDAAELEMAARGVSQSSLAGIAKRAKLTRGAIYWHFADKQALIEAMVARTHLPLRDMRECLGQHIPGNQPLRLLREMMQHGLGRLRDDERHRRVCHIVLHRCEVTEDGAPVEAVMRALFEDARAVLLSLCGEIEQLGQVREDLTVTDVVDIIMAFMSGSYECMLRHPDLYDSGRDRRPLIDALLRGIFDTRSLADDNAADAAPRSTLKPT